MQLEYIIMAILYCCGPGQLYTLPNKEGSWVLGLQSSVAKIPVLENLCGCTFQVGCHWAIGK